MNAIWTWLGCLRFAWWWIVLDVSRRFGVAPRFLYGRFYDSVTSILSTVDSGTTFLDYGYAGEADSVVAPGNPSLALYHRTATAAGTMSLDGKDVLEVGSGLGGGAAWVARNLAPRRMIAVDLSPSAIRRCRARHLPCPGLSFEQRDAQALGLADASFDVVLSVESSHTYPDFERFAAEVHRVLRPGGYLLLTDFRPAGRIAALSEAITARGFAIEYVEDISANVVAALRLTSAEKDEWIASLHLPRFMANRIAYFAGTAGSEKFARFERREDVYVRIVARKR